MDKVTTFYQLFLGLSLAFLWLFFLMLPILMVSPASAEFSMSFGSAGEQGHVVFSSNPATVICLNPDIVGGDCNRGDPSQFGIRDPDKTPFRQEITQGPDGNIYKHIVMGAEEDGFIQELYIRAHGTNGWFAGVPWSASGGAHYNGGADTFVGNAYAVDPLSPTYNDNWEVMSKSGGAGSGNPERVIFRQKLVDEEFSQEVSKGQWLTKPRIQQTLNSESISSAFDLAMSTLDYRMMETGLTNIPTGREDHKFENTMTIDIEDVPKALIVPGVPFKNSNEIVFDMGTTFHDSNANAGFYTYTHGDAFKGAFGDYEYFDSSFEVYGIDWAAYSNGDNVSNE